MRAVFLTTSAADETRLDDQVTQAAVVTESPADPELAELARWLDEPEATQDEAVQNPEPDETESDATTGDEDPELEAAVQARAERLAEEKIEAARAEDRKVQDADKEATNARVKWEGITTSFRQRSQGIRQVLNQVVSGDASLSDTLGYRQDGTPYTRADWVVDQFNSHHAQIAGVRDAEWHDTIFANTLALLPDADKERVTRLKQVGEMPLGKILEERDRAVAGKAKEGMHSEARLKDEHSKGALAYRSRLDKMLAKDPTGESVLALLRSRTTPAASRNTNTATPTNRGFDPSTASIGEVNDFLTKAGV